MPHSILLKNRYRFLLVLSFLLGVVFQSHAQTQKKESKIQPFSSKTRILTGTAGLRWYNFYDMGADGLEENSNTELNLEFRHFWMVNRNIGWGLQGQTKIYMTGLFGNVGLGNMGIGPMLREYPWKNKHWQVYVQGGFLAGYDLALGDALGANRGEGMRYRTQLRTGLTYRVSNKFGIYLELGPDWEADESFTFDSRALELNIGIQLLRF